MIGTFDQRRMEEFIKQNRTRVFLRSEFVHYTLCDRPLSKHVLQLLADSLEDQEIGDFWVQKDLGLRDGWNVVEQKLYKGKKAENMPPGALFITVRLSWKPRPRQAAQYGFFARALYALAGMVLLDSFFPAPEGQSTFARDTLVGFGIMSFLDSKNTDARQQAREED